jgi:hypothetical protein
MIDKGCGESCHKVSTLWAETRCGLAAQVASTRASLKSFAMREEAIGIAVGAQNAF